MKNKVDMADLCELAHELTVIKCREKKIVIDRVRDDETRYTRQAQAIFDKYYDLITNILRV